MNKNSLAFLFAATLLTLIIMTITGFAMPKQSRSILIYGHRGARWLAPENSIHGYKTALKIGVNYVDMDVGVTKNGVVVVTHDFALNPDITRDKHGKWIAQKNPPLIKNLTFKQLQSYDVGKIKPGTEYSKRFPEQQPMDGTRMPSLRQVIRFVKQHAGNKVNFQVEIKNNPKKPALVFSPEKMARAVVKILQSEQVTKRSEIQSFNWQVLQWIQKLDKNIATAYLTNKTITRHMHSKDPKIAGRWSAGFLLKDYDYSLPKMIAALGGKVWGPESAELTKEKVAAAHRYGLKVVPWTVDTKAEMQRMIKLKVDGIITDRPVLLRQIFKQNNLPLPSKITSLQ